MSRSRARDHARGKRDYTRAARVSAGCGSRRCPSLASSPKINWSVSPPTSLPDAATAASSSPSSAWRHLRL